MLNVLFGDEDEGDGEVAGHLYTAPGGGKALVAPVAARGATLLAGLDNQGTTCYLNALVQALYMNPDFRKGLYSVDPQALGLDLANAAEAAEAVEAAAAAATEATSPTPGKGKGGRDSAKKGAKSKAAAAVAVEPSQDLVEQLVAMGMTAGGSARACVATGNKGLSAGMEYYFVHDGDAGFHDDFEAPAGGEDGGGGGEGGEVGKGDGHAVAKGRRKGKGPPWWTCLELQRLFVQLQGLDARSVGTERLTVRGFDFKAGDASVQHDVQELITKLLDKLDMELSHVDRQADKQRERASGDRAKAKSDGKGGAYDGKGKGSRLIGGMFEYESRTELVCGECGHASGPPVETNKNFFVPVRGFKDMSSALAEAFKSEARRTECDSATCNGAKRDKQCSLALRRLPPLLWCSLLRFEYDWAKQTRVKITDPFAFPLVLDLAPHVAPSAAPVKPSLAEPAAGGAPSGDEDSVASAASAVAAPFDEPPPPPPLLSRVSSGAGSLNGSAAAAPDRSVSLDAAKRDVERAVLKRAGAGTTVSDKSVDEPSMACAGSADPLLYDLVAVVLHSGGGHGGHYISLARDQVGACAWDRDAALANAPRPKPPKAVPRAKRASAGAQSSSSSSSSSVADPEVLARLREVGPLEALTALLRLRFPVDEETGLHRASADELSSAFAATAGVGWSKVHKKQHGTLAAFVKANPDAFLFDASASAVLLLAADDEGPSESSSGTTSDRTDNAAAAPVSEVDAAAIAELTGGLAGMSVGSGGVGDEGAWTAVVKRKGPAAKEAASAEVNAEISAQHAEMESLSAARWGRWFRFDDSSVSAAPLAALAEAFEGRTSAYMLLYRSRVLGPLHTAGAVGGGDGAGDDAGDDAAVTAAAAARAAVEPPEAWRAWLGGENARLAAERAAYEASSHSLRLEVVLPVHLVPVDPASDPFHLALVGGAGGETEGDGGSSGDGGGGGGGGGGPSGPLVL